MKPQSFLFTAALLLSLQSCTYYFGNSWERNFPPFSQSDDVPELDTKLRERQFPAEVQKHPLLQHWAAKKPEFWSKSNKGSSPRILLAKLAAGKDIDQVNEVLMKSEPWGSSGSTGPLYKKGDYDFVQITLCSILYLFGDQPDLLYPETRQHLVQNLIIESGGDPDLKTPRTFRIMRDTENHILMTEGSRYLKNQWLYDHGNQSPEFNNRENGLEEWFLEHLDKMQKTGMYEFNSRNYLGYTITTLMTLHAFSASEALALKAQQILDSINREYALGSLNFKRNAAFRRRLEYAGVTDLNDDPHTAMMLTWNKLMQGKAVSENDMDYGKHQALIALLLPYLPDEQIMQWCREKPGQYLARIGHGFKASPEIHSGGNNYLLSAGGVQRRKVSQIVARPTVLLLEDGATDYRNCFHLKGKGKMKKWNNTGVYHNFACANAPVQIPEQYHAFAGKSHWKVFQPYADEKLLVATYNETDLGLLLIFPDGYDQAEELLNDLLKVNPDQSELHRQVTFPDQSVIAYDVNARKSKWVIKAVNGKPVNRKFDGWARLKVQMMN